MSDPSLGRFLKEWAQRDITRRFVLEIGTKRWSDNPTHHRDMLSPCNMLMTDVGDGVDVDIVSDAHALEDAFMVDSFDAVFAASVWEHLQRPWIAAQSVLKVLKPGGLFFVQTHFCFPVHGYPDDYFRFTNKALALIFEDAGAVDVVSSFEFGATLKPHDPRVVYNESAPVWLNTSCAGRKPE